MLYQVIEDGEIVSSYGMPLQYDYLISDEIMYDKTFARTTSDLNYTKVQTISLPDLYPHTATIRVKYSMRRSGAPGAVWSRIYKNGASFGATHTHDNTAPTAYSEDLSFTQGDTIEMWQKAPTGNHVVTTDFRICGTYRLRPVKGLKGVTSTP